MIIIAAVAAAIAAGLWVAHRYQAIGAIGLSGVAVAAIMASNENAWWNWAVLALSVTLFVTGQLVPKAIDDYFHWGALFVNALEWIVLLFAWIIAWPFWTTTAALPLVLVIIGFPFALVGLFRVIRRLSKWIVKKWRRSRRPNPVPAAPANPVVVATQTP